MIDFIKTWGYSLVCAAFVSAICNVLLPKNSLSKAARFVVGLFLVATIIAPFTKKSLRLESFNLDQIQEFSVEASVNDTWLIEETNRNLNRNFEQILRDEGIQAVADCTAKIDADNRIFLDEIIIYINSNEQTDAGMIEMIILQHCGTRPLVLTEDFYEKGS